MGASVDEEVSEDLISEIESNGSGSMTSQEFLSYILVNTGKVERHEIEQINALFATLDRDRIGVIDTSDVRNHCFTGARVVKAKSEDFHAVWRRTHWVQRRVINIWRRL